MSGTEPAGLTRGLRFMRRVPFQSHNMRVVDNHRVSFPPPPPSPPPPQPPTAPPVCICERPMCQVLCKKCNARFKGRVRKKCPVDKQTFLMDHNTCPDPNCGAGVEHLVEEAAASS